MKTVIPEREHLTTILVVDDEPSIRRMITVTLKAEGYHVLEARHGREALELIDEGGRAVDLLVTDMQMPHIGGQELIERLRGRRGALKFLAISGYPDPKIDVAFLAKPFALNDLLQAVKEALDHEGPRRSGEPPASKDE